MKEGKGRGSPWLKRFLIGSLQSLLFNDWVALRMALGLYDRVVPGDWAKKHATGGSSWWKTRGGRARPKA